MIKIPAEVLSAEELIEATGRDAKNLDIEITGISLDRSSLVLSIDTRLNFVMPMNLERLMKERIREKIGSSGRIRINYMYRVKLSTEADIDALHENAVKTILAGIEDPSITIGELLDRVKPARSSDAQ